MRGGGVADSHRVSIFKSIHDGFRDVVTPKFNLVDAFQTPKKRAWARKTEFGNNSAGDPIECQGCYTDGSCQKLELGSPCDDGFETG